MGRRAVDYFEALAPSYAQRYTPAAGLWHHHFFEGRRRIALEWLAGRSFRTVADVGAGHGPLTDALAAGGARVLAIDGSAAMAREAARLGATGIAADALALPLRSGSVDAAVALGLASYVEDLAGLMRELGRVVRPGGTVVVSVASARSPDWWMRRALRMPAARWGFRGLLTSGVEMRTRTPREWERAAQEAGLRIEEVRGHDFTVFPLSRLLPGLSVAAGRALEAHGSRRLAPLGSEVMLRLVREGAIAPPRRPTPRPLRLVRVIARLNVGGPAIHVAVTTAGLRPDVETVLATGRVDAGEAEASGLLATYDVEPVRIRGLGRSVSPLDDLRAFASLLSLLRRVRPDVVHTHTAKAGAIGRVAARLAGVPHVVHTFHGHVFEGYFGAFGSRVVVAAERALARLADRIVAVSPEVGRDLTERFRIAPRGKVDVVPVGLPLGEYLAAESRRGDLRRELRLGADVPLVSFVGRLVPVKDPALALDAWRLVRAEVPSAVLVVVGDGPLGPDLRARGDAGVRWLGWRRDVARVLADADLALLTSRNEGTPVALVEAAAAGLPSVATAVGGVPSVVGHGRTGLLVPGRDPAAIAAAVVELLRDAPRRSAMGAAAREAVRDRFSDARLCADLRALYAACLRDVPGGV